MIPHRLYVGCIGEGVFRSLDQGQTFRRAADGMPFVECDVRALCVDPHQPATLYVGNEEGVLVSRDSADNWEVLPGPFAQMRIWAVHVDARRPGRILAGTSPADIVRSEDGGRTWQRAETNMVRDCPRIRHTRVTCMVSDPDNPDHLWAGIEIDGVHESLDGGKSWSRIGAGRSSEDIHALAVVPGAPGQRRLLAATNRDLNVSDDGGTTWQTCGIDRVVPWLYNRSLVQVCGSPEIVLLGTGDGPPGSEGCIVRSRDAGRTWSRAQLPGLANSTIWNFAVHSSDRQLIYAASVSGEVYRSTDAGETWSKLPREFGEIRGLAWTPL
jgi:photosystem II stability/assembly factor-like uncharacterized protein